METTEAEKWLAMYAYKQIERKYTRCMEMENEMRNSKPERKNGMESNGSGRNRARYKSLTSTASTLFSP